MLFLKCLRYSIFLQKIDGARRCGANTSRGPARPAFQTAAARLCVRRRPRGSAETSGRFLPFASAAAARKRRVQAVVRELGRWQYLRAFSSATSAIAASPFCGINSVGSYGGSSSAKKKSAVVATSCRVRMRSRISGVIGEHLLLHILRLKAGRVRERNKLLRECLPSAMRANVPHSATPPWDRTDLPR